MTPAVEAAFVRRNCDAVRYVSYWEQLTARSSRELFQRYLFAFCSVHTTWEGNVRGYQAIRGLGWDKRALLEALVRSGCGLHNNRSRFIWDFTVDFWRDPSQFMPVGTETWAQCRDRLVGRIKGLGPAKVSFALELAFPLQAEVLCLDVHMLRLYRRGQDLRKGEYEQYENDWLLRCSKVGLPSYIVKQIHWDGLQGRSDSRYWSHVLEV